MISSIHEFLNFSKIFLGMHFHLLSFVKIVIQTSFELKNFEILIYYYYYYGIINELVCPQLKLSFKFETVEGKG